MKKLQNIYKSKYIIIGAGIGGLSLALALQKLNKKVLIFEKAPEIKEVGAGVMLTPNATRSLDYLGVLKEIEKEATLPKRTVVRHYKTGEEMSTTDLGNGFTKRYGHPYYDVHRVNIHSSLYNSVKRNDPDCIKVNHELIDFDQSENVVTAKFKNNLVAEGDFLIGCDGIHSLVRKIIKASDNPHYTGNLAWRGLMPIESLPFHQRGPEITIWIGPKKHVVEYTVKSGKVKNYVAISNVKDWHEEGWTVRSSVHQALTEFNDWHEDVRNIISATPKNECYKWGLFDRNPLSSWSENRVTILGDAAHPMLPFMAQGAAMSIEDAVVLSRCFLQYEYPKEIFESYEAERIERTAWCQLQSREAGQLFQKISSREDLDSDRAQRGRILYEYDAPRVKV